MKPRLLPILTFLLSVSFAAAVLASTKGNAIHEERYLPIGGIEHWVTIKGDDRDNPVVLFIHGGPGNPLTPLSHSLYPDWEREFTLVHYDQRGAGKTYQKNLPVEELTLQILEENELTLEQLTADGSEIATYVADYLEKDTLILTGTSWGSALAVRIYENTPQLFSNYIGLSQMVNYQKNFAASYTQVLKRAKEKNDEAALQTLAEIGPPPWTNPRNPGRLRRIVREYESERTSPQPKLKWKSGYDSNEYRNAYLAGEEFSWIKFVGMQGDGFSNQIHLDQDSVTFHVPINIIQGAEDLLTTPDVSKKFFDSIVAPKKRFILVPDAGHDPNIAMLRTQIQLLRELRH